MALFQHCSVLFELKGLPFKEKKNIKLAVTDNGGKISFVANKECSLIVTSDVSSLSPSRLRNITKHQIPVVGLNYVYRCVEANCQLPVEDFKLDVSSSNDLPVTYKDKWSGSAVTSKPFKSQAKPLEAMSVTHSAESPKRRGSVIENYRVYDETDRALPKFPENFEVAKYSMFQKPNGRSWCLLELQSAKTESGRSYRLVKRWKDDVQSKVAVRSQMVFMSMSEEAVKVFQALADAVRAEGLKQQSHGPPQVTEMGSAPLQQLLLEEKLHTGALTPEVGQFVELLWQEALGCIDLILSTPVHKISLNDVTRAEGILLQLQRKVMENKNSEQCSTLWTEYNTLLPLRFVDEPDLPTISKHFDLCQLIRDILNVSEMTLGSTVPTSVGKYRALRCSIEAVSKGTSEFETVASLLQLSKVQVHQILRISRPPELQSFKSELGNLKPLLHSSRPHNFVGILSRGLLLPGVAVSQHGIQRTDAGDLGSGIYFSDDINTTLKYSQCSLTDGSRFVLVCDVALGRCKDLYKKNLTLTQAPQGHDSVHGVCNTPTHHSDFKDDEYVVYSTDQVKLKYVVQLSLEGDELKSFTPEISQSEEPFLHSPPDQAVGEVGDGIADVKNPLDSVTAGLLNSSGQQIPLQAVHVKCKLVDLLAQVIIFQQYTNNSPVPIEAKYVFPLDDSAAVCGFEAFINGKHVVGQVKEKETARKEYKQAIEKGHGAYLMDQDAPDVFTISVGNLPSNATVLIKVTFVSELIVKDGSIFFSLPSSVAPWQESAALNQTTQVTVEKVCVTDEGASTRDFNLDMSIEMPHEITEVKCVTHQVKMKKTDCKAVVSVLPGEVMGPEGFQLLVTLTEVHVPRMWVEQHPGKDSQACMLVFYPKFEATFRNPSDEVVLLLDASQSMKGESFSTARMIALQILKTLDHDIPVNVIFFGTDHTDAFLSAQPIDEARQEAKNFIKHFSSAGGSTELWRPLRALSLLPPSHGTRNLLLLSDGHIQNTDLTLQLLRDHAPHTRLFTCGLSSTANRHMLRALAQAGGGAYEFFDSKSKHTWSEKVKSQVKRMQAPGARSVSVKWQQFNPTAPPPVQAPKHLHALFNDCHTLVFGFVPHCTKATLLGNLSGQEIETMVSTTELQKTKGTFLHKLTARAIIRDFEDGSLDSNAVLHEEKKAELKSFVIELSKEFSILSQFTSFVAIEERDSDEEKGFTDIPKLIAEEDMDFLPYMSWTSTEDTKDSQKESTWRPFFLGGGDGLLVEEDLSGSSSGLENDQVEEVLRSSSSSSEDDQDEEVLRSASSSSEDDQVDEYAFGSISRSEDEQKMEYESIPKSVEPDEESDEDMGFSLFDSTAAPPSPMEIEMSSKSVPEAVSPTLALDTDRTSMSFRTCSGRRKGKKKLSAQRSVESVHRQSDPVQKSHMPLAPAAAAPPPPPPPPGRRSALFSSNLKTKSPVRLKYSSKRMLDLPLEEKESSTRSASFFAAAPGRTERPRASVSQPRASVLRAAPQFDAVCPPPVPARMSRLFSLSSASAIPCGMPQRFVSASLEQSIASSAPRAGPQSDAVSPPPVPDKMPPPKALSRHSDRDLKRIRPKRAPYGIATPPEPTSLNMAQSLEQSVTSSPPYVTTDSDVLCSLPVSIPLEQVYTHMSPLQQSVGFGSAIDEQAPPLPPPQPFSYVFAPPPEPGSLNREQLLEHSIISSSLSILAQPDAICPPPVPFASEQTHAHTSSLQQSVSFGSPVVQRSSSAPHFAFSKQSMSYGMANISPQAFSFGRAIDDGTLSPLGMGIMSAVAVSKPDTAQLPSHGGLFGSVQKASIEGDLLTYQEEPLSKSAESASHHISFSGFGGRALARRERSRERERVKPSGRTTVQAVEAERDGEAVSYATFRGRKKMGGRWFSKGLPDDNMSKWTKIFSLQNPEGYWEVTTELGKLLNCNISLFAEEFLKKRGIASLGEKAHADILKLLATLLVLQLMRLDKLREGQLLRTLFCLEDSMFRPEHWEAVNRAVEWARWADRQYPCVYSRLEFGLSWDSSTKQLLGAERIHHCSPLTGLNLNPRPTMVQ